LLLQQLFLMFKFKPMVKYLFTFLFIVASICFTYQPATTSIHGTRVWSAKTDTDYKLQQLCKAKGLSYPPARLYMRVFKSENVLEVWAANTSSSDYILLKSYEACAMSGELGPKLRQGDKQVPEGFYHISGYNPWSLYYLSMKVSYPNAADRKISPFSNMGGDIFMHGMCKSIGCVSIGTPSIKEVYWLTSQVRSKHGQRRIPMHIFPARLSDAKYNILQHLYQNKASFCQLWSKLKIGYDYFEETRQVPRTYIDRKGNYQFKEDLLAAP
jgi:murein L,D-transpeptidase YafK